jgi:glycosyltransferase involved in cell wall biosynthesis
MNTFSIVIPVYNNYSIFHQLLFDIYKVCSPVDEVVIVDDCSTDIDLLRGVDWWIGTGMLPIKYLKIPQNFGFLRASNYGLKKATGDIVSLISTDVRIYKNIVEVSKNQTPNEIFGGRLLDWDTGWNAIGGKVYPYLEGWLLTAHRTAWERLEYFDELFSPNDMEDIDLSTKALALGMTLKAYDEGYVSHLGARTIGYNAEREELTKKNKKKFEQKWSK